jgi:hypothetical protein
MSVVNCLDAYVAQGNTVKGCNVTIDQSYAGIDSIQRIGEKFEMTVVATPSVQTGKDFRHTSATLRDARFTITRCCGI